MTVDNPNHTPYKTVTITEDQYDQCALIAKVLGKPLNKVVRDSVSLYLKSVKSRDEWKTAVAALLKEKERELYDLRVELGEDK